MYEHKNYYDKWRSVTLQTDIFFGFKIYENTFLSQKKTTPYYNWLNCWTKAKIIKEQHFLLPVACLYTSHPLNFYENGQKDIISKEERNWKKLHQKVFFSHDLIYTYIHMSEIYFLELPRPPPPLAAFFTSTSVPPYTFSLCLELLAYLDRASGFTYCKQWRRNRSIKRDGWINIMSIGNGYLCTVAV